MDLARGIYDTARAIGADPLDLATVISYETAGTFDPTKRGPTTQWGQHRGLIQFGEPQAQQFGVNWDDPLGSQLGPDGAVARYMRASGYQPGMGLLDLYSTINAGAPGLYNRTDANNGGAPGTVRDKVEQQMAGHRQNAERLLGGELSPTMSSLSVRPSVREEEPVQPRGLLNMPQMPEERQLSPRDALQQGMQSGAIFDGIAGALNSLRHRPSREMAASLASRDARRNEVATEARGRQERTQAQNRTMQVAAQMFGEDSDIFKLAAAGMISGADVAKAILSKGQGVRGIEINGQLVNAETGAVIGDYRDQGAAMSEAEQEIARLTEIGIPRDVAIKIKEGVFTVSRDPMTGEAVILDKSNQRVIFNPEQTEQAAPAATPAPATPPQQFPDASNAFGAEGLLKGGINAASDFIGLGTPFQGVNETSAYFGVLQEQIINDVASAYQRQPPSWLLQNIRELTPEALSGMGPQRAQTKLTALRQNFETELTTARRQEGGPLNPANRQALQERIVNMEAAIARIDGALGRFGGGASDDIEAIADRWAQ